MGLVDTQPQPEVSPPVPDPEVLCRCGYCHTLLEVPENEHCVHCPECGRSNRTPGRVYVTCERCGRGQRIRFKQRNNPPLCANCGHTLRIHEIELTSQSRHIHHHGQGRSHVSRHDSVVFTILLYAVVLTLFLLWLSQR